MSNGVSCQETIKVGWSKLKSTGGGMTCLAIVGGAIAALIILGLILKHQIDHGRTLWGKYDQFCADNRSALGDYLRHWDHELPAPRTILEQQCFDLYGKGSEADGYAIGETFAIVGLSGVVIGGVIGAAYFLKKIHIERVAEKAQSKPGLENDLKNEDT
jgi:hypothetical protein